MAIAIISVAVITALVYCLNRFWRLQICPICAGVSLTWLGLVFGVLTGQLSIVNSQLLIALLMGGTVVGIAFQGEKRFVWAAKNIWYWKAPVIIVGLPLFYWFLIKISWLTLAFEIIILMAAFYVFFARKEKIEPKETGMGQIKPTMSDLEKKLEECC